MAIKNKLPLLWELNNQIKQALDTSTTAIGKIVIYQGRLRMMVSLSSDVYLGTNLRLEKPRSNTVDCFA